MSEEKKWEQYGTRDDSDLVRIKVDGGYLYSFTKEESAMCFVPDIDLQRYQAHLRDAYRQGYAQGHEDAKRGIKEKFDDAEPKSIEEAEAIHHIPEEVIYS